MTRETLPVLECKSGPPKPKIRHDGGLSCKADNVSDRWVDPAYVYLKADVKRLAAVLEALDPVKREDVPRYRREIDDMAAAGKADVQRVYEQAAVYSRWLRQVARARYERVVQLKEA